MGYGYYGTFLVIFLTHPGVVLPTMSSATSLLPPEAAAGIPSSGFPPVMSGLWQVLCAWALGAPGNGSPGLAATMLMLYQIFIGLYLYLFFSTRIQKGV
jgi:hypothetical protein